MCIYIAIVHRDKGDRPHYCSMGRGEVGECQLRQARTGLARRPDNEYTHGGCRAAVATPMFQQQRKSRQQIR